MVMILHPGFLSLDRVMNIKHSCLWSGRLQPSFSSLGRVDGEVSKKNDTVPCPKHEKLGCKLTLNTNFNTL